MPREAGLRELEEEKIRSQDPLGPEFQRAEGVTRLNPSIPSRFSTGNITRTD
jgi:hypothetical protein